MGYFSNGSEQMDYEGEWCDRCVHQEDSDGHGCSVMLAHWVHGYDECNNKDSILHILIPMREDGIFCDKCTMFYDKIPEVT